MTPSPCRWDNKKAHWRRNERKEEEKKWGKKKRDYKQDALTNWATGAKLAPDGDRTRDLPVCFFPKKTRIDIMTR